jgi:hypothetical protein
MLGLGMSRGIVKRDDGRLKGVFVQRQATSAAMSLGFLVLLCFPLTFVNQRWRLSFGGFLLRLAGLRACLFVGLFVRYTK